MGRYVVTERLYCPNCGYSVYALVPRGRGVAVLKNIAALAKNRRWRPAGV